jgi:hypothetical protein
MQSGWGTTQDTAGQCRPVPRTLLTRPASSGRVPRPLLPRAATNPGARHLARPRSLPLRAMRRAAPLLALLIATSCRRRPETAPVPSERHYCWWTSRYLAVAPAWVAARFENALQTVGFTRVEKGASTDSAWALAGPSTILGIQGAALFGFRAVAYPAADSLHCAWRGMANAPLVKRPAGAQSCFHTDVSIYAPRRGWAAQDSTDASGRVLHICGEAYKVALEGLERLERR